MVVERLKKWRRDDPLIRPRRCPRLPPDRGREKYVVILLDKRDGQAYHFSYLVPIKRTGLKGGRRMRKAASFWAALLLGGTAMAADFSGAWKLNVDRSTGKFGDITSYILTLKQTGPNAYRTTTDIVDKSGKRERHEIDRVYDGQERPPIVDGKPAQGTNICVLTDTGDRKITMKRDGKVYEVLVSSISDGGKTLTNRITTDKGQFVLVFEKQ